MGTVTIRNLDDEVIERAKQRQDRTTARSKPSCGRSSPGSSSHCRPRSSSSWLTRFRERTRGRTQVDGAILQREGRDWLDAKAERIARGNSEP